MTELLINILFVLLSLVSFCSLRRMRIRCIGFADGVFVGFLYFLWVPMAVALVTGSLNAPGIDASPYYPYVDIATTTVIFIGWAIVLLCKFLSRITLQRYSHDYLNRSTATRILFVAIIIYVSLSLYTLLSSGLLSGGAHWLNTIGTQLATSTTFTIYKNVAMALRVMLFGLLAAATVRNYITRRTCVWIATCLTVFDVLVTYNRITLVFLFVLLMMIYSKRAWVVALAALVVLPAAAFGSEVWMAFRGMLFSGPLTLSNIAATWSSASAATAASRLMFDQHLNAIFESSDIVVLNYVVRHAGLSVPYLYGETFFVRPLTAFIPTTLWPSRPQAFGTLLGNVINSQQGLALNSTLFAEPIANFGFLWWFITATWISLADVLYTVLGKWVRGMRAMSFFIGFAMWRFDSNFCAVAAYAAMAVASVAYAVRVLRHVARSGWVRRGFQRG